nr:DUF4168 domain-containing protein [Nostocaceae cyanobacterium]
MMSFCHEYFRTRLKQVLGQSIVIGSLATLSLVSGLIPNLTAGSGQEVFSSAAHAEDVNSTEIKNYALAVLGMEPVRQEAYNEIKKIIGQEPPAIACYKTESLSQLPRSARRIAVNYCNRSKQIVESNNLSSERFNAITQELQGDDNLKNRISNELIRIQNSAGSR